MKRIFKNELYRIILGALLFIPGFVLEIIGYDKASTVLLLCALIVSGYDVFIKACKGILRRDFLDEKFLMSIASVGAFIIGESTEGAGVMLFFLVGEYFEHKAVRKNREAIRSLLDICPDTARVLNDGTECEMDAEDVEVGSIILIRPGERVPIDCRVVSGNSQLDTSSLTGESMPINVSTGDEIFSGVVVLDGVLICETVRIHSQSRAARVLELVENARESKSREENFITKFSVYYTPIVTVLALLISTIPAIFGLISWQDSIYRGLSFLVISCPCALVISVPMAFFGGIGAAATQGILYKGGNTFSPIAKIERAVFDKTGTLTTGEFSIIKSDIRIDNDEFFSLVASAEHNSNHPIAKTLKRYAVNLRSADEIRDVPGKGIIADVSGYKIAVGNVLLMSDVGAVIPNTEYSVYAARDGEFIGAVLLADTVKAEASSMIGKLRKCGVKKTYILSGDRYESVKAVAEELSIDEYHASLMPENKYKILEAIIAESKGGVVYVGDGINDAPCITRADVGIAMGRSGTDSAIESADAVIMSDDLEKLPQTVKIARKTLSIAKENIIFAISVKILIMILASLNIVGMWMAVFADVGVAVIAILNAMRALSVK